MYARSTANSREDFLDVFVFSQIFSGEFLGFLAKMQTAGFENLKQTKLTGGIASIYLGYKKA